MAGLYSGAFNPAVLSQDQKDLLAAALASNRPLQKEIMNPPTSDVFEFNAGAFDSSMFSTPQSNNQFNELDFNGIDDPSFLSFLESNGSANDDNGVDPDDPDEDENENENEESNLTGDRELHDKRKSPGDEKDSSNSPKRREGEEKVAKKPGRKPLTSEPTSKRKAQNRAAQRAFRERKEKHLKELETKVSELEKSSESTNHENGMLRAQVERLQNELREYRRRLSSQNSMNAARSSPPTLQSYPNGLNSLGPFNFDMPKFSNVTYPPLFSEAALKKPSTSPLEAKMDFGVRSPSMTGSSNGTTGSLVQTPASTDAFKSHHASVSSESPLVNVSAPQESVFPKLHATSIAQVSSTPYNIFTSPTTADPPTTTAAPDNNQTSTNRIFVFQPGSSPSTSSMSYNGNGGSSSCGTSPEPSAHMATQANKDVAVSNNTLESINENANNFGRMTTAPDILNALPTINNTSFDLFAVQDADPFDVLKWTDYSENNTGLAGDSSFAGGFMNDAQMFDFSGPMDWNDLTGNMKTGLTPSVQKSNPMEDADLMQFTTDTVKEEHKMTMMPCQKIWAEIQERPDFKDGTLDIDSLCTELRIKARCSETGMVVDTRDVQAALDRQATAQQQQASPSSMI